MTSDDILKVLVWAAKNNVAHVNYDTNGIEVSFFQVPQASTDARPEIRVLTADEVAAMQKQQLQQGPPEPKRETDIDVVLNPGKDILFPPDNEP